MTSLAIRVDCATFEAASTVLACEVAQALAADTARLLAALDRCDAMAGDDPAGVLWGGAYDDAVAAVFRSVSATVNASFRLAGLLEQSGFNYGAAESASVLGGCVTDVPDPVGWANQTCNVGTPGSAVGPGSGSLPTAWSLIEDVVAHAWPNGHQDRLHAAASAWRSFASALEARSYDVTRAYACIDAQDVPEASSAHRWCATVAARLRELSAASDRIAAACDGFAGAIDQAHSDVLAELNSLLHWTEGIQITGGLFAIFTFGLSEAAAQAAEATRIAVTASRVGAILGRLTEIVLGLLEPLAALARQARQVINDLRPLLTARIVVGAAERASRMRAGVAVRGRLAHLDDPKLFDPRSLRGLRLSDIRANMPAHWLPERDSRAGGGWIFEDPARRGRQLRVMPGYPPGSRPDRLTWGPYLEMSQNGKTVKVALDGNPTLP